MHHTAAMYAGHGGGLDTDGSGIGYGQTAATAGLGDGTATASGLINGSNEASHCYFDGQANVITDGWTVTYSNGLNPMKQMEGKRVVGRSSFLFLVKYWLGHSGKRENLDDKDSKSL